MVRKKEPSEPSESEIQDELRRGLSSTISLHELITTLTEELKALGKKRGTIEEVAAALAKKIQARFGRANGNLQKLIEHQPRELQQLLHSVTWKELSSFLKTNPEMLTGLKRRRPITSEADRVRRTKKWKNLYERRRRPGVNAVGLIEKQFGEPSGQSLSGLLYKLQPSGYCLDDIFHGGEVKMCDGIYSLQSLFGLNRKKLKAARPWAKRGREFFYDYRAVTGCMKVLLGLHGANAPWLPDPSRRRTVLSGVLSRAKQQATQDIAAEFERILQSHVN